MTQVQWSIPIVFALVCAGCASAGRPPDPAETAGSGPVHGGSLAVWKAADVIDWDPNFEGRASYGLWHAYDTLTTFKTGPDIPYADMIVEPRLAQRWEISPDGKSYTFHLRRGVKFADLPPVNGRELTAADVKWTAEYATGSGELAGRNMRRGRNDYMYEGMDRVEVVDPYTARFHFKTPFVPFLNYSASEWNPVLPREIFDQDGSYQETIAGTGPFQLDPSASQKGTRYVFKKNPTYWEQGKPYLDEVRILVLVQDQTAKAAFHARQIDVMRELFITDIADLSKAPHAQLLKYIQPRSSSFRLGQAPGQATTDLRVRRAVNLAMDRDEINKVFAGGDGEWGLAGGMHGLFTQDEIKQTIGRHDPEGARRLLTEAGYPDGITLFFPTDNSRTELEISVFQLIQAQLKKAGMNVELAVMDRTEQRKFRRAGKFDLDGTINISPLEADNDSILYGEYHSKSTSNNAKVRDPELDKLLEAQRQESNPEKRRQALRAAVKRIWDMQWQAPMVFPPRWDAINARVKDYRMHLSVRGAHLYSWLQN